MSKIYLASSKPARMADTRIRIECDLDAMEPTAVFDLVFSRASDCDGIPSGAIYTWQTAFAGEPAYFYTTETRASEILGESYSLGKLREAMEREKQLWLAWAEGRVYRIVTESWSDAERDWLLEDAVDGAYGESAAIAGAIEAMTCGPDLGLSKAELICCDDELVAKLAAELGAE